MTENNKRYNILDLSRGLAVINMLAYHMLWDLKYIYGFRLAWYGDTLGYIWQRLICCSFILLSGFCYHLGTKRIRRGVIISIAGLIITAVTSTFMPDNIVIFGILTFLGAATLITVILEQLLNKIPTTIGFAASILLFILFYNVNRGYILSYRLPRFLYSTFIGTWFGFMQSGFYSTDYFSILPWIFIYTMGYYLYDIVGRNSLNKLQGCYIKPINLIGRNTLIVYLLHQPIIYFILNIII